MSEDTLVRRAQTFFEANRQVLTYLIAGGYNTVFGFGVFTGLFLLLEDLLHYLVISAITHVIAITNSFLVYRYLVFKSQGNFLAEYLKIYLVYGFSFVISLVLLALLVEILGLHPIPGQFIVILISVVITYIGNSRFTFRKDQNR